MGHPLWALPLSTSAPKENVLGASSRSLQLSVETQQYYFTSSYKPAFGESEHADRLESIGLSLSLESERVFVDQTWFYVPQEKTHYFNIPELSVRQKFAQSEIWFGRHKQEWSKADEFWQNGLWQPVFRWDGFNPAQQGFTGLFYNLKLNSQSELNIFASAIFIPSWGPAAKEENNRIVSQNPWVTTSPPRAKLWDISTPVNVNLDKPEISDVVLNGSLAASLRRDWSENHYLRLSYAYKPINTPLLAYEYYLRSGPSSNDILVTVHPTFPYEHIASIENTSKVGPWQITPSYTYDEPQVDSARPEWITQDILRTMSASLIISRDWDENAPQRGQGYFGLIKTWEKMPHDLGENAPEESQFMHRTFYSLAAKLGTKNLLTQKKRHTLSSVIEGIYDARQEAGMFKSGLDYQYNKNFVMGLHVNLIGATSGSDSEYDQSFMRIFKANDNVGVNLGYVY